MRGWLVNVSVLDAVELTMRDGRLYRLGTDEPARLERAIREAVAQIDPINRLSRRINSNN